MALAKQYKDLQFYKFCFYGFLKNLKFFEPFFILFLIEKGLSFTQIALLYTLREILIYITEIPTGLIADALGRKRTMVWSFGFYIISFLIFYFSSSLFFLLIAIAFFAFGDSFRTGTHKAMIFEYLKIKSWQAQKVDYYGGTRSCSQLGSALSSLIAATIVFINKNYSLIFLASVVPYFLDMLLIISYPDYLDGAKVSLRFKDIVSAFKRIIKDLIISLKQANKLKILFNVSSFSGYFKQSKDYLQYIIQSLAFSVPLIYGLTQKQQTAIFIGIAFFLLYLLTSRASKNSGKAAKRFASKEKALNGLLYFGLTAGLLGGMFFHFSIYALSILFFILIYLTENFRKPIGIAYISENFSSDSLATTLSVESLTKTVLASVFALIIGFLADCFDVGIALSFVSVLVLVLGIIFRLKR
ncbi:MAG: MFS transporter [Bacteroidales bacterium]|nr:MFS transporter [Bacteroidales bacterium]